MKSVPTPLASGTTLVCPIFDDQGILGNLWLLKHKDDALDLRFDCSRCESVLSIRQAQLNRAVQAQVEELVKLNQLKDDFSAQFSRIVDLQHKNGYFMLTLGQIALGTTKPSPSLSTNLARRICAGN